MNGNWHLFLFVVAVHGWTSVIAAGDVPRVNLYGVHEVSLSATDQCMNPYTDLTAEVTFTPPDGRSRRVIPMFWDGEATWKFRFSPEVIGVWQWAVTSRDSGLNGKSGSCEVVKPGTDGDTSRHGSIRPMTGFPSHFERQDGTPFWFAGDTAWALYYDREDEKYDRGAALAYRRNLRGPVVIWRMESRSPVFSISCSHWQRAAP